MRICMIRSSRALVADIFSITVDLHEREPARIPLATYFRLPTGQIGADRGLCERDARPATSSAAGLHMGDSAGPSCYLAPNICFCRPTSGLRADSPPAV